MEDEVKKCQLVPIEELNNLRESARRNARDIEKVNEENKELKESVKTLKKENIRLKQENEGVLPRQLELCLEFTIPQYNNYVSWYQPYNYEIQWRNTYSNISISDKLARRVRRFMEKTFTGYSKDFVERLNSGRKENREKLDKIIEETLEENTIHFNKKRVKKIKTGLYTKIAMKKWRMI